MKTSAKHSQSGFSLAELMIALAAGLILSGAVLAFTLSSFKSNSDYVRSTRLTQELRNSLDLVSRELRRAGYDEDALNYLAKGEGSPFTHLSLGDELTPSTSPKTYRCVIYAYDRDGGVAGTMELANREVRGIRWASRTVNGQSIGVLEYAESAAGVTPACNGTAPDYSANPTVCEATSGWCPLSDPTTLDITRFGLVDRRSLVGAAPTQIQLRDIDISIIGRPAGSTEYTRGMRNSVRVRSECWDPSMANCSTSPHP